MALVERREIVDYQTYNDEIRTEFKKEILDIKSKRRIHVGDNLTFLFENHETIKYQIQEMILVERIIKEKDILHEIKTYNELIGTNGSLGCSLLVEIESPEQRDVLLRKWVNLTKHIYAVTESGEKVYCKFDSRQMGEERLSSVQYLIFPLEGSAITKLGCDHPELNVEYPLSESQVTALKDDL